MRNLIKRPLFNSIRYRIIAVVMIVLIPVILLLLYINIYAINAMREQVAESNKNFVSLYLRQVDNNLEDINQYLSDLIASDMNLRIIYTNKDQDTVNLAIKDLSDETSKDIFRFKTPVRLFFYSPKRNSFFYSASSFNWQEENMVRPSIEKIASEELNPYDLYNVGWQVFNQDGNYFLMRMLSMGNDIYVGAWIFPDPLLDALNNSNFGETNYSLFATDPGEPMENIALINSNQIELRQKETNYYISGQDKKFIVVSQSSTEGNFSLYALTPDEKILVNFPYIANAVLLILIVSILMVPAIFVLLRKFILTPVNRLLSAMMTIREDNIETRIPKYKTSEEFRILNETFNSMMDQIKNLKINIYEEQLNKQKAELEHLQLQVNPHFFMNSLNIIHSLAQIKNYKLIQEMVQCLVKYFRFMFRSNITFVSLADELEHVKNYLHIQELRFKGQLVYEINVSESVYGSFVPPLVIQTFVENTIKYGVIMSQVVYLNIKVESIQKDSGAYIKILIQDTGAGFPLSILEKLRIGERIIDERGEHVGIWNVMRRLQILYPNETCVQFYNVSPNGAAVEIVLPANHNINEGGEIDAPVTDS